MVALVFLKPGAGVCFWRQSSWVNAPVHEFSKFSGPQNYPGGLLGISWVLVSEFTPQWPSPLSLRFWISNKTQRRCRGSHGGHTWRTPCWLSAPLGPLWICFICQPLLLSRSFSGSRVCIVKPSRWFCSKTECEKPFMWVWSPGHDLISLGICHHPSLLVVQILEKKPVDPVYLTLHTLGHWSLVSLVDHILNQPWKRWTFFLKALIHEVWCAASFKNFVILSEVREKKSDII